MIELEITEMPERRDLTRLLINRLIYICDCKHRDYVIGIDPGGRDALSSTLPLRPCFYKIIVNKLIPKCGQTFLCVWEVLDST